jgi:hypothetical protein
MKRIRRILYASDFSKASGRAFTTALALAKTTQARLTILNVIVPLFALVPEQCIDSATLERLDAQTRQWSQRRPHGGTPAPPRGESHRRPADWFIATRFTWPYFNCGKTASSQVGVRTATITCIPPGACVAAR